jgi:hypothetical protein
MKKVAAGVVASVVLVLGIILETWQDKDRERRYVRACLALVLWGAALIFVAINSLISVQGRDLDGRYANSPLHEWFNGLKSGKGLCCSFADGKTVEDPDWESKDGHYRVKLDGDWYDVSDEALITEPNQSGRTMVWPVPTRETDGHVHYWIRCFMPGAMG